MRIKISSDSTCDLPPELIERYDIAITPLCVTKGDEVFHDGVDIRPADIFAHVEAGGALCGTTAVSVGEYSELFAKYSGEYDAVIQICIGSGFSSSYQNACVAAEDFPNVRVIDSQNLSTGQGHVVIEACKLAEAGKSAEEIVEAMTALAPRIEASFIIDRLDYMAKGGRCSTVAALGANLLKLKPCIEVTDGKMHVCKKYRGSFDKCLEAYVTDRLKDRDDIVQERIFITHSPVSASGIALVKRKIAEYGHFAEVYETDAGCTVSCHCGPGTLGVLFIRSKS